MRLRILTLNVQGNEGDPRRIGLINRELRRITPDLVALQEVSGTSGADQLARILEGTDLHGTHQADVLRYTPPWADRYGGTAVATRWPHQVAEVLDLRMADAPDVPWCTLAVTVHLPDNGDMLFIATTTSWRLDAEAARERQAVALTDLDSRHRQTLPTIIAGDLNATPDATSIRYLTGLQSIGGRSVHYHDAWTVAGDGPGYTWTVDNPVGRAEIDKIVRQPEHRRRIDYVFVGSWHAHPRARCHITAATLAFSHAIDGVWASDHYGVLVDVDVKPDS